MPVLFNYNVFISHAWEYSEDYLGVVRFLNDANHFTFKNFSVPADDGFDRTSAVELTRAIERQIRPASVVLIVGGIYVSHSKWIQYEIDFAATLSKPIIGIMPRGQNNMPQTMRINATRIVGWNGNSIVQAIREVT